MNVDVSSNGAVLLGGRVTCDGFHCEYPVRVQTHIHTDHMDSFDRSKGYQHVLMTEPTRELLIAYKNEDLPYRVNIEAVPAGKPIHREGAQILLLDSGHMLGSVQVAITLPNGLRCGYSGDFNWPLEDVIQVDELVMDCTYGSPCQVRRFDQEEVNSRLVELVIERIKVGPVLIMAHRGTLQRAISCLNGVTKYPIIVSPKQYEELRVYQRYGYNLTEVYLADTPQAKQAYGEGRYLRLYGLNERRPTDPSGATCINLSAYMSGMDRPVVQYSENSFAIALSDHADYEGTLEYVRATGAKKVVTDDTRSGHAIELALALKRELGIEARPSRVQYSREWGR